MKKINIILLALSTNAFGQNLVMNPSFEEVRDCCEFTINSSMDTNQQIFAKHWYRNLLTSPDLYRYDNNLKPNEPRSQKIWYSTLQNRAAPCDTVHGKNFSGIFYYSKKILSEYLTGEFTTPLQKNKQYKVSFYCRFLSDSCMNRAKVLDVLISNEFVHKEINKKNIYLRTKTSDPMFFHYTMLGKNTSANLKIDMTEVNNSINKWVKVSAMYTAKGGEQFINFGKFYENEAFEKETKRVLKKYFEPM